MITPTHDMLLAMLAEDGETIIYRPRLRSIAGSVTAAIFLARVVFWRKKMGRPFYKFREVPKKPHPQYKKGDSWAEELNFGTREIRGAIESTSATIKPSAPIDMRPGALLWRWTTRDRLTFWDVNVAALSNALALQYGAIPPNGQNDHYQKDKTTDSNRSNRPIEDHQYNQSDHNNSVVDGADAPENQTQKPSPESKINPIATLPLPDGVTDEEQRAIAASMATLDNRLQEDVLAVITARMDAARAGRVESIHDPAAFASSLVKRARAGTLTVPQYVAERRRDDALADQVMEIQEAVGDGGILWVDGAQFELECGKFVRLADGTTTLAALLAQGARIETRRPAAREAQ